VPGERALLRLGFAVDFQRAMGACNSRLQDIGDARTRIGAASRLYLCRRVYLLAQACKRLEECDRDVVFQACKRLEESNRDLVSQARTAEDLALRMLQVAQELAESDLRLLQEMQALPGSATRQVLRAVSLRNAASLPVLDMTGETLYEAATAVVFNAAPRLAF